MAPPPPPPPPPPPQVTIDFMPQHPENSHHQFFRSSSPPLPPPSPSPLYLFRSKLPDIDIPDHMPLLDYCLQHSSCFGEKPCLVVKPDEPIGKRSREERKPIARKKKQSNGSPSAENGDQGNEGIMKDGGGEAEEEGMRIWSYREVEEGARRVGAGLLEMGIGRGQVVMLMLPNSAEFVVSFLGVASAAAIATTCNPNNTPREILHHFSSSRPSLLLTLPSLLPKVALVHRLVLDLDPPFEFAFRVMVVDPDLRPSSTPTLHPSPHPAFPSPPSHHDVEEQCAGHVPLDQRAGKGKPPASDPRRSLPHSHEDNRAAGPGQGAIDREPDRDLPFPVLHFSSLLNFGGAANIMTSASSEPDDVVALPYSSGTTGLPKGVMLTHRGLVTSIAQQVDGENPNMYFKADDTVLCVLPMFHIYSLSIVLCCLRKGATMVIMPKFKMDALLELVQHHRITIAPLVPPIVLALTRHPIIQHYDLSSIRMIMCGAAPLSKDQEDSLKACLPHAIFAQGYGMTEAGSALSMSLAFAKHPFPVKSGSCGTVLRNALVKLIDPTTGRSVSYNQPGEICIKGNQIMKGYVKDDVATSNAIDEDGFLHTGDIGIIDDNDELFIVDRVKEIIKFKGFQVPPAELEGVLLSHPHVHDAACVGKKDEVAGEVPVAFVVPANKVEVTEDELKAYVASQVVFYKKLHKIIFVDYIPKSASGKILRKDLRKRLESESIS